MAALPRSGSLEYSDQSRGQARQTKQARNEESASLDHDITDAMRRRSLLQLPLLQAQVQSQPARFKLSVRVEPLFPGLPLEAQIQKVAEAGYHAFEFGDW